MSAYRRRLPHFHPIGRPLFVTWRLYGSLPENRAFPEENMTSGEAFVAMDRLLEECRTGPVWLRRTEVAQVVVDALRYGEDVLGHYELHAFVVMPNHVHLLLTPRISVPRLLRSLKGITAKRANEILGLTGKSFWQDESYDHVVRDGVEMRRIRRYIELNPVRAGLCRVAEEYPWSSAGAGRGAGCGPGGPPHNSG